jgi:uncharacterized protein (TIGR02996 family)
MTSLDSGLMTTILKDPDDDAARLIAADWWEEHGEIARGEFIRVQCDIARCQSQLTGQRQGPKAKKLRQLEILRQRDAEVWRAGRANWTGDFPGPLGDATNGFEDWRRGFVWSCRTTVREWNEYGRSIVLCQPITFLVLAHHISATSSRYANEPGDVPTYDFALSVEESRTYLNETRTAAGLPPLPAGSSPIGRGR